MVGDSDSFVLSITHRYIAPSHGFPLQEHLPCLATSSQGKGLLREAGSRYLGCSCSLIEHLMCASPVSSPWEHCEIDSYPVFYRERGPKSGRLQMTGSDSTEPAWITCSMLQTNPTLPPRTKVGGLLEVGDLDQTPHLTCTSCLGFWVSLFLPQSNPTLLLPLLLQLVTIEAAKDPRLAAFIPS